LEEKFHGVAVVDLFSGPGGLSLGFKNAGFKIVAAVERDKSAAETYRRNFPSAHLFVKDIKHVSKHEIIRKVREKGCSSFIVVAGPPCQPFSPANRQNGGKLHPEASSIDCFVQLVLDIKPLALLFENVPNFMRIDDGESFNNLIEALSQEYVTSSPVLNTVDFGVPQRRKRLFVAGVRQGGSFSLEKYLSPYRSKTVVSVQDAISDLPAIDPRAGGWEERDYPPSNKDLTLYQMKARFRSVKLYNHVCPRHSEDVLKTIRHIKPGMSLKKSWPFLPPYVKERYKSPEKIHGNIYRRLRWDEVAPTIVHPRRAMLLHPEENRVISVREAARLQSFPDVFRFYGGKNSQYQQVADAVPPLLAEAVAKALKKAVLEAAPFSLVRSICPA